MSHEKAVSDSIYSGLIRRSLDQTPLEDLWQNLPAAYSNVAQTALVHADVIRQQHSRAAAQAWLDGIAFALTAVHAQNTADQLMALFQSSHEIVETIPKVA